MTLLDDDIDEKICPYINVTGIDNHSFNMCPTQYTALPHTTSPLPLYAYFIESKRWLESKKPRLSIASTITFGGFIAKIRWDQTIDKAILSMEIKITNIAYISNWPEISPHYEFFPTPTHTQQTIMIPQELTLKQQLLEHNGIITNPQKQPLKENTPSTSQQHPTETMSHEKNSIPLIPLTNTKKNVTFLSFF